MKNKNSIIIGSVAAFVLLYFFAFVPYLHYREATRTVQAVLKSWQTGDMGPALNAWYDINQAPPVYELVSGKITKKNFNKKGGVRHALIYAILEFNPGNNFPSGKEWVFELSKTRLGWKIVGFYSADSHNP